VPPLLWRPFPWYGPTTSTSEAPVTYAKLQAPMGSITPEEITYSPFVPAGDEFDAYAMDAYEFAGAPPLFPPTFMQPTPMQSSMPMQAPLQRHRVMQMPGSYVPPPGYKLVPLGVDESTGMSTGKKVAIIVAVIIAIGAVIYYIKQNKKKTSKPDLTPTQAVKKLPTSRLAQNLYARLAKNGKASRGMMVALGQIAQE